jgi:hypothetical protein
MKYPEEQCQVGSLWRHSKGGLYLVIGIALDSTNPKSVPGDNTDHGSLPAPTGASPRKVVVYWSFAYRGLRVREAEEFLDGRFTPVAGAESTT